MTQSKQMIRQSLRQVTALTVFTYAGGAESLRQRRAVRSDNQRHVSVSGGRELQSLQYQQLTRRVRKMILTAQHVRHAHAGIVDGIAEKELGGAVGPAHHEVPDVIGEEALGSVDEVGELDPPAARNGKAGR